MRTWMGGSHIHSVVSRLNFSFSSVFMLFVNESLGSALSLSINISTVNDKKGLHFNAWMGKLDDSIEWLEWNSPVDQFPPRDINGLSFLYGFFFVSFRCHRMYLYRSRNFNRKPSVWNRKFLERLGDWISGCRTKHQRTKHKQHA